ncbi:MAG: hypothetical protein J2O48_01855 [Solirubrobacterales bacterium]|nr:hypothetical protein [Solirubrobacterales bacterium]
MPAEVTVVGVGCELDRVFAGQRPVLPVPALPRRDDLRDLFDAISGPVRAGHAVIVVVGDWVEEAVLDRLYLIRSLLQTHRVVIHITPLPPLAAGVLAAVIAALADEAVSPGVLAGALKRISERIPVLAWTSTVAGLRHPDISVVDHARSTLPWASFAVGFQPQPFVAPLRAKITEPLNLDPLPESQSLLMAPSEKVEQDDLDLAVNVIIPALGASQARQMEGSLHGPDWWGTRRVIEISGVPTDLHRLAVTTLPQETERCRWCDELIGAPPCPMCGDRGSMDRKKKRETGAYRTVKQQAAFTKHGETRAVSDGPGDGDPAALTGSKGNEE